MARIFGAKEFLLATNSLQRIIKFDTFPITCSIIDSVLSITWITTCCVSSVSILYALIKCINAMKNGEMKLKLFDKVFVIIFIISSIISLNSFTNWIGDCHPISDRNKDIINRVHGLSYLIQLYILSLLFFNKLQLICNGTIIYISVIAVYFYKIVFSLLPIYIFISLFLVLIIGIIPVRTGYGLAIIFVFDVSDNLDASETTIVISR